MLEAIPTVNEDEATGRIKGVYARIRVGFPYVPLVFQALAIQPVALELAWAQSVSLLSQRPLADAAVSLYRLAAHPPAALSLACATLDSGRLDALHAVVSHFAETLPVHALLTTSLALALDGRIPGLPAEPLPVFAGELPAATFDLVDPEPSTGALRRRFRQLQTYLGLPYVDALWRVLASDPRLLDATWEAMTCHLDRHAFRQAEAGLNDEARRLSVALAPEQVCSPGALEAAGIREVLPAVRRLMTLFAGGTVRHLLLCHLLQRALSDASEAAA